MASVIRYLVLEIDNQDITDLDRFVTRVAPRTPHLNMPVDCLYHYEGRIIPIEVMEDVGAKLYLAEVIVHDLDGDQEHPYLVIYRETVDTTHEETEFLMRRIVRVFNKLLKLTTIDMMCLEASQYWNVMYIKGWMDEFNREFAEVFECPAPK